MPSSNRLYAGLLTVLFAAIALPAGAQTFKVQCPNGTARHPAIVPSTAYSGITIPNRDDGKLNPTREMANPNIKCQQISGGDGFATMGDGTQTYLFGFGPLSGLSDMVNALPGTEKAQDFNQNNLVSGGDVRSDVTVGAPMPGYSAPGVPAYTFNGAIGLTPDPELPGAPDNTLYGHIDPRLAMDVGVMNANMPAPLMAIDEDDELFLTLTNVGQIMRPDLFEQHTVHFHGYPNASAYYDGVPDASLAINVGGSFTYYYLAPDAGTYFWHCHISPPEHLQMGMVGQIYVRPRQNKLGIGADLRKSLTDLELPVSSSPTPAEYERLRKRCGTSDVLCSTPIPVTDGTHQLNKSGTPTLYAYNDGDGSTAYDVEYPIQIHGFDPNFHFVGMTFNPESFTDMKDKYFLLNGRSYPDTVGGYTCTANDPFPACTLPDGTKHAAGDVVPGPMQTQSTDGTKHSSQPLPTIINIPVGGKALLRISDLDVTEFQTLASLGIKMHVVGVNARLLRDMAGKDMTYFTNSITLGGGESIDVILDASDPKYTVGQKFYLYTPNLDHLSNDAENFGGLMTEINICGSVDPKTKACSNSSVSL
jgi:FtsP/CotA-like multicopper oxidase with cupredoxin domain